MASIAGTSVAANVNGVHEQGPYSFDVFAWDASEAVPDAALGQVLPLYIESGGFAVADAAAVAERRSELLNRLQYYGRAAVILAQNPAQETVGYRVAGVEPEWPQIMRLEAGYTRKPDRVQDLAEGFLERAENLAGKWGCRRVKARFDTELEREVLRQHGYTDRLGFLETGQQVLVGTVPKTPGKPEDGA